MVTRPLQKKLPTDPLNKELREWGLATFPGAHTKSPWPGHLDLAMKDKTFAYLSIEGDPFSVGCKLPRSNEKALMLPGVVPTGYGLGKCGWVGQSAGDVDVAPWVSEMLSRGPRRREAPRG